jgi:hypothetical protein
MHRSYGVCGICGITAPCNDTLLGNLPIRNNLIEQFRDAWGKDVDSKKFVDEIRGKPKPIRKSERKARLLEDIAKLIVDYENPTGHNCSNDVGSEITLDFGRETEKTFIYDGESFVEVKKGK